MGASISESVKRRLATSCGLRSYEEEKKSSLQDVDFGRGGGFWSEWGVCESLRRAMGELSSADETSSFAVMIYF
jgi:hypothetical protein